MSYTAGRVSIQNEVLTNSNEEYEITLPTYYKKILVQARQYTTIKFSFTKGESGTEYITVKPGTAYWEDNIRAVENLYVQSPTAGTTVEVIVWDKGTDVL